MVINANLLFYASIIYLPLILYQLESLLDNMVLEVDANSSSQLINNHHAAGYRLTVANCFQFLSSYYCYSIKMFYYSSCAVYTVLYTVRIMQLS